MCDRENGCHAHEILIPEAVEYGGSLFYGKSPISRKWLIGRLILLFLSYGILSWSITYHVINNKLLEWVYWMNNWSLLLTSIYLTLSCIVTYKILRFVNKQQSKLSNLSSVHSPYKVNNTLFLKNCVPFVFMFYFSEFETNINIK